MEERSHGLPIQPKLQPVVSSTSNPPRPRRLRCSSIHDPANQHHAHISLARYTGPRKLDLGPNSPARRITHIGSMPMIKATVDQSFLDRLAFKYVGQVRGSGLTGSFGVSLSEALADEVARDRITMPVDGAWRLRLASGRRAARDIVEYDYRWMIGKIG
jgi:hypothetical protein